MASAKKKVVLAMSGGVDSSVAAAMLKDDGYEVVGCFMRLGSPGETLNDADQCDVKIGHQGCCSINDAKDAQHVAAKLGIAFYVLNFKRDFGRIIDYFAAEYNAGRTPNPCVRCNDWLKFGKLADYARSIDADYVASGHYARVDTIDNRPALLRGVDESKDQSYVLFGAKLENLRHTLLPVGGYRKAEIRRIAEQFDLPVFDKPDSQEICFVPDTDYARVVRSKTPGGFEPGEICDTEGNRVGEHEGHQHFTIGQRRGVKVALGYPIYVVNKDAESNTITIGPREALASDGCVADQTNWLIDPPTDDRRCHVKIRYNARPVPASVHVEGELMHVRFDQPQDAVAPGQAVVCYDGERVLGGGWIKASQSAAP
jgi:tRNA-specific 2-thiouridylase